MGDEFLPNYPFKNVYEYVIREGAKFIETGAGQPDFWGAEKSQRPVIFSFKKTFCPVIFSFKKTLCPVIFTFKKNPNSVNIATKMA